MIVFLDPGHSGANDATINRQVPTGRGGTKDCQTSDTTTGGGFPEHTFNWDVVLQIRQALDQLGVRSAMSRGNNDAQSGPAVQFATMMRDQLVAAGLTPSTYIGSNGLYGRSDLTGLNLARYPSILVETGNMKNANGTAQMESAGGALRTPLPQRGASPPI